VSFFTFYSYENIFFANSFKFVPLREVNELAFQISIREFYVDLVNLNFSSLFRSNDYGYGFIFWSIYGFFVTPFYFLLHSFPDSNLFSIFDFAFSPAISLSKTKHMLFVNLFNRRR
jgi:hypothetical protein